jgi:hypothetical protein
VFQFEILSEAMRGVPRLTPTPQSTLVPGVSVLMDGTLSALRPPARATRLRFALFLLRKMNQVQSMRSATTWLRIPAQ